MPEEQKARLVRRCTMSPAVPALFRQLAKQRQHHSVAADNVDCDESYTNCMAQYVAMALRCCAGRSAYDFLQLLTPDVPHHYKKR